MKLEISRKAQVLGFLFHRERGGEAYLMKALRVFPGCSVSSPAVDTSAPPCRQPAGGEAPAGRGGGGHAAPAYSEAVPLARCHS